MSGSGFLARWSVPAGSAVSLRVMFYLGRGSSSPIPCDFRNLGQRAYPAIHCFHLSNSTPLVSDCHGAGSSCFGAGVQPRLQTLLLFWSQHQDLLEVVPNVFVGGGLRVTGGVLPQKSFAFPLCEVLPQHQPIPWKLCLAHDKLVFSFPPESVIHH